MSDSMMPKSKMQPDPWPLARSAAEEALASGKFRDALDIIRPWVAGEADYEERLEIGGHWPEALALLARAADGLSAGELSSAAAEAAGSGLPADWLRAGHELVERGWTGLAAGLLKQAHRRHPSDAPIAAELVAALELEGKYAEAAGLLGEAEKLTAGSPLLLYLRAFNSFMAGDVDLTRHLLPELRAAAGNRDAAFMLQRLESMLARHDAISPQALLDRNDLRGWHFVTTGGLLLHAPRVGGGEAGYGWKLDTDAAIKEGLYALAAVMSGWRMAAPIVWHPPERGSEITALALSEMLGSRCLPWYGGAEPGMIVMYDPDYVVAELREAPKLHAPNQSLFMHTVNAAREHAVAPDMLARLHGRNTAPWGPGFAPDGRLIEPASGTPDTLAAGILAASLDGEAQSAIDETAKYAERLRELPPPLRPAALLESGRRERLWAAPVGGNI